MHLHVKFMKKNVFFQKTIYFQDSISQLKWSTLTFGVYQFLVLVVQLIFSVMFGDIVSSPGQGVIGGVWLASFVITVIYLSVLFFYGKHLHQVKKCPTKLYR